MTMRFTNGRAALLVGAAVCATVGTANAQTTPATPPGATTEQQPAGTAPTAIGDIVVTAQRRSESLQSVPIAISAFNEKALVAQRLDTGSELVRSVPNVNFSKGYFGGFNFQIRGVGTQLGAASADNGVGIHINNVPLTISRFFEAEFYDTERVEVLRGPQGTLYGRNATGGVVNVVTNKPTGEFSGMLSGEIGTYDSYKAKGYLNVPLIGDKLAVRIAGSYLARGGFGINTATGKKINDRELWSGRATIVARPADGFEVTGMWQHFEEHDRRTRTNGESCVQDPGKSTVGGVAVTNPIIQGYLSQGCSDSSIYSPNANQAPNSLGTIFGYITQTLGLTNGNFFAGKTVSPNFLNTDSLIEPRYDANSDIYTLNIGMEITPTLKVTTISSYLQDSLRTKREFLGAVPNTGFAVTALTPNGFFNDPQLGNADRLISADIFKTTSEQYTQEVRLDTSFDGPFNLSLGGIYVYYKTRYDNFVFSNTFTLFSTFINGNVPCALGNPACIYIEPNLEPQSVGHNYFDSAAPYQLNSEAAFGEVYYKLTDRLKVTLGGRFTHDSKKQVNLPVTLLVAGSGQPVGAIPRVEIDFREPTGRLAIDWTPDVGFTDRTLFYAVASRGYKGGGTNSPASFVLKDPYLPEFVNAIEVGTKNTLLNGRMTLNLTAFHYDYKDYQVAEIRNRTSEIQNIDAKVKGIEFEGMYEPVEGLRFNSSVGLLDTRITKGSFVDTTNFLNKSTTETLVRGATGSTCGVNTAALATYLATNPTPATFVSSVCAGRIPGLVPNLNGNPTNLIGKEMPNAPKVTVASGAQYTARFGEDWSATLRGDYYWQGKSFARTYNTVGDRIRSYDTVNATLTIDNESGGLSAQLFAKNLFNSQPITNTFVLDQIIGVARAVFVTEPRVIGVNLSKRF